MRLLALSISAALLATAAMAEPEQRFSPGPIITEYGPTAIVADAAPLPKDVAFKVAFDVAEVAEEGKANRRLESAARFLNLHARAGVPAENMSLAIVVHGGASADLVAGDTNTSQALIEALLESGVRIELCGQTAAYRGISKADLVPGIVITHSAMTSHARLQQDGYTLNPF